MWIKISVSRKVYSFELYKVEDIKQVNFKENESERNSIETHVRAIFVWPWKMVRDPFNQNSNRSDQEKWSTSKGGPVFLKLFRLDRTDPLSFGPKFPEILVEWIAPMVSVSVRYLFYQPMDEKIKTWPLRFPAKENPNMEKTLCDWPIVLHCGLKAKYQFISRKFSGMKFFTWAFGSVR